jgi:Zn-dependent protease
VNRRGIPLGRYGGVPVTVGLSWIVVVPIVGLALFAGIDSRLGQTWERVLVASVGTALLFASVLIHELGHAIEARRRGVGVERIVVFLFGGYSEMDLDGVAPADDIAVSLAGPVASTVLAVATLMAALLSPGWAGTQRTLALLGLVNVGVAVFNLLPGFPLDGGRIVRATLIAAGFERRRAEVVTARLGVALGLIVMAVGAWMTVRGRPGSIVVVPVGVLLFVIALAAHPRGDTDRTAIAASSAADPASTGIDEET